MSVRERKYIDKNGRLIMTRLATRADKIDRSFDIEFWQRLSEKRRMDAMWELVEAAHAMKGGDPHELRFQRSVESVKRRKG
jgi:hypothetical protein